MAIQEWHGIVQMVQGTWTCGHCGLIVGANLGFYKYSEPAQRPAKAGGMAAFPVQHFQQGIPKPPLPPEQITPSLARILICPSCEKPTFFDGGKQVPGVAFGGEVAHLPPDVSGLYAEARNCMAVSAFTASVLATRKLLMNVAVSVGADVDKSFQTYVNYLADKGYVPPNSKEWVDHIRQKANEATHEIPAIVESDARDLLTFMEMILKLVFEFPKRVPKSGTNVGH